MEGQQKQSGGYVASGRCYTFEHALSVKPRGQVAEWKVNLTFGDRSSVKEAYKMSRSVQGGLIFQAFAVVHPQTLGRLH